MQTEDDANQGHAFFQAGTKDVVNLTNESTYIHPLLVID